MSEYIFVHLIDKKPIGTNLDQQIPLHMTVLHWFEINCDKNEIVSATENILRSLGKITTKATIEDMFGPNKDVPVMRLNRSSELINLHSKLFETMKNLGASFDERWVGEANWNPHVTHKDDNRLNSGDIIKIEDIDLITRQNENSDRIILNRFQLGFRF